MKRIAGIVVAFAVLYWALQSTGNAALTLVIAGIIGGLAWGNTT